jgi:hypothetical protein
LIICEELDGCTLEELDDTLLEELDDSALEELEKTGMPSPFMQRTGRYTSRAL